MRLPLLFVNLPLDWFVFFSSPNRSSRGYHFFFSSISFVVSLRTILAGTTNLYWAYVTSPVTVHICAWWTISLCHLYCAFSVINITNAWLNKSSFITTIINATNDGCVCVCVVCSSCQALALSIHGLCWYFFFLLYSIRCVSFAIYVRLRVWLIKISCMYYPYAFLLWYCGAKP